MTNCLVCRNAGIVKLRLFYPVDPVWSIDYDPDQDITRVSHKEFPCPECKSNSVKYEKLQFIKIDRLYDPHINDPNYIELVRSYAAHDLIEELLKQKLIKFDIGKEDVIEMRREITATIYVVAPKNIATFAQRVQEQAIRLAHKVITQAKKQINNWGSYYKHNAISKKEAFNLMDASYQTIKDEIEKSNVK
jgi:predicted DNA-binding protein (MmcQ/YjbR family)